MFITSQANKSPISALFANQGLTHWSSAELGLQLIWFVLQFKEIDRRHAEPSSVKRTILAMYFDSVEQFIQSVHTPDVAIEAVYIVTPGHVNGTGEWAMDSLARVWNVQEREHPSLLTPIFETRSGRRYASSVVGTPTEELIGGVLRVEIPYMTSHDNPHFPSDDQK